MTQLTELQVSKLEKVLSSKIESRINDLIAEIEGSEEFKNSVEQYKASEKIVAKRQKNKERLEKEEIVNKALASFFTTLKSVGIEVKTESQLLINIEYDYDEGYRGKTICNYDAPFRFEYFETEINVECFYETRRAFGLDTLYWDVRQECINEAFARLPLFPYAEFDLIIDSILEQVDVDTTFGIMREEAIAKYNKNKA